LGPSSITVAIIGAGPLGRRLALHAAQAGFRVILEDVMPSSLRHAEEVLRQALGPENMPLVRFASTVEDAVREADLAIDCVPDELESKLEIFSLLDRMAPPRTVFATPTTNLSIADLASCTYRPGSASPRALKPAAFPRSSGRSRSSPSASPADLGSGANAGHRSFHRLGYHAQLSLDSAEAAPPQAVKRPIPFTAASVQTQAVSASRTSSGPLCVQTAHSFARNSSKA
jgi:hypothetical protein